MNSPSYRNVQHLKKYSPARDFNATFIARHASFQLSGSLVYHSTQRLLFNVQMRYNPAGGRIQVVPLICICNISPRFISSSAEKEGRRVHSSDKKMLQLERAKKHKVRCVCASSAKASPSTVHFSPFNYPLGSIYDSHARVRRRRIPLLNCTFASATRRAQSCY